jgi:hypothetical protein
VLLQVARGMGENTFLEILLHFRVADGLSPVVPLPASRISIIVAP